LNLKGYQFNYKNLILAVENLILDVCPNNCHPLFLIYLIAINFVQIIFIDSFSKKVIDKKVSIYKLKK